jgi:transcriptional regulator with XRE-family HTH domain
MRLEEYRRQLGWSQAELARQAGISSPTVSKAEAGESINGRSAILICKALGRALEHQVGIDEIEGWTVKI